MSERRQVGCYYFPNYHVDPRNEKVHGSGWSEWQLVEHAHPHFEGHVQPKIPLWGFDDESDPAAMAQRIDAAANHGVDFFIFDWYWYDDGPFLERGLEKGFLKAKNNSRMKFCLMWANHDWQNIHPAKYKQQGKTLYPGVIKPETFTTIMDHAIETYFKHPSHFMVNGCPYFSIYELGTFVKSFGTVQKAREALDEFRGRTKFAGFPDIHLNGVVWGSPILPGESKPTNLGQLVADLGFDSTTSYVWVHHWSPGKFHTVPYETVRDQYFKFWDKALTTFKVPYYPNVTMGWDSSPRTVQSEIWEAGAGYPFTPIIDGNTPAAFREALVMTRQRLEKSNGPRIVTINAWNEWTEGSYLEPDTVNGLGYLEAIKAAFG
ncbi:MAG: hypothetical protein C0404_12890 [Verrucomicrobia bacterium]|nr:hypothetical protein [Verrucomicrobiota bacterium]